MSLTTYRQKRNFQKTAEPAPEVPAPAAGRARFVIQKHAATRLHYDLRLEMGRAFKSWAVPKGLPYAKGEKRLAVQVEDHPLAYGNFEGTIPKGEYGGGTVMLWDSGTFSPLTKTPVKDLKGGKLHFLLEGAKLRGEWYLVRLRGGDQWLVIKGGEDMKPVSAKKDDTSVLSGKSMKQLAKVKAVETSTARKSTAPRRATKMPPFIEPMMAKLTATPPPGKWLYEIKFDGWRALALKAGSSVQLFSRNRTDFTAKFPELVEALSALRAEDAIIDGEIVAVDGDGRSSFQLLQTFDTGRERPSLLFYAFDLLRLNGTDLTARPLTERRAKLQRLLRGEKTVVKFSDAIGHDGAAIFAKARELGLEGLIGKRPDSPYEPGRRSGAWIKLKFHLEQEFVIGGYTDPEGARQEFGALIVGYYDESGRLMAAGKVGTGFDADLLRAPRARFGKVRAGTCPFANIPVRERGRWGQGITPADMKKCHWLKPKLVCQVKFAEWTRDGRLRQPVFLGLRADKRAADVVRETPV